MLVSCLLIEMMHHYYQQNDDLEDEAVTESVVRRLVSCLLLEMMHHFYQQNDDDLEDEAVCCVGYPDKELESPSC